MSAAIVLQTIAPGVLLRVTPVVPRRDVCFLACVQADTVTPLAVMARYPQEIRPAAGPDTVQFGTVLVILAAGQRDLLFAWLQEGAP